MSARTGLWAIAVFGLLGAATASAVDYVGLPIGGENGDQWVIYQRSTDTQPWTGAFANAATLTESVFGTGVQGQLLTPDTAAKNEIAFQLARDSGTMWIAATDQEVEGEWKWATTGVQFWQGAAAGTPVNGMFNSWNPGLEPNDSYGTLGEDYATCDSGGTWNDIWDDYNILPYWTEFQTEITGMDVASLPAPNASWQFVFDSANGTYLNYARTKNRYNWYLGKLIAEKAEFEGIQGQLPVSDSAEKNAALAAAGGGWVALHSDPNLGGTPLTDYFWSTPAGETPLDAATYANWADGEPNNAGGVEWHTELRADGWWNDLGYAQSRNALIEFEGVDISDRQYAKCFLVREVRDANGGSGGNGGVANVEPRKLINGIRTQSGAMVSTQIAAMNLYDPDAASGGNFGGDAVFQTDQAGVDDDNFAVKGYATIVIPEAGTYTFGRSSDDAIELVIDRGAQGVHRYVAGTGTSTTEVTFDAAGEYNVYVLNGETGGGAGVELHAAKGSFADYSAYLDAATLVGDKLNGGIETRNLRMISTAGNFSVNAGGTQSSPAMINYGGGTTGITGDYGFDQAFDDGTGDTAMTATTEIVVPENAAGWWTIGSNATKGVRLSLVDSSSNPVAFGGAYGAGQLNAGAVEMTAFTAKGSAFGAVELAPGTYTLTAEYGIPATITPRPTLSIVDGFDLQLTWVQADTIPTLVEVNATIDAGLYATNGTAYVGPDYNPNADPIDDIPIINYGAGADGHYDTDSAFPGEATYGGENFVMKATTQVVVDADAEGYWTFCVNSDDGFQLRINDTSDSSIVPFEQLGGVDGTAIDANGYLQFDAGRGASDSFGSIYLAEGTYDLDLRWFEWGGGNNVELSYAAGEQLAWDGSLFQLLGNAQPQPDNLFEVFYAAGTHDGFDGAFDLLGDNLTFEDQSAYYDGLVTTELEGDLNSDGVVNSADLDLVRGNWGQTVSPNTNGDGNGDGFVNSADLDLVRANWGATATASAVPEPSVMALLLGLAALGFGRFRR